MTMPVQVEMLDRVFHALAKAASPEEILALHSTPEETQRFDELIEKQDQGKLVSQEVQEVHQFFLAERYVRLAKAYAFAKLNGINFE